MHAVVLRELLPLTWLLDGGHDAGMRAQTACQNAAALPPSIAANMTTKINNALLPNANKSYSNSTQGAYVSFTTPSICWSGNWCASESLLFPACSAALQLAIIAAAVRHAGSPCRCAASVPLLRFGFHIIPGGCLQGIGGKTYQGSTGRTTTVSGIYGLTVAINASQTSCSASTGVVKTTNAFTATATWPPVTLKVICVL